MGVDCKDCLFFDDNYTNLATAKRRGCAFFGVKERFSKALENEIKEISEEYIEVLSQIVDIK